MFKALKERYQSWLRPHEFECLCGQSKGRLSNKEAEDPRLVEQMQYAVRIMCNKCKWLQTPPKNHS